jgi:hypothetical protein
MTRFLESSGFPDGFRQGNHPTLAKNSYRTCYCGMNLKPFFRETVLLHGHCTFGRKENLGVAFNSANYGQFAYGADAAAHLFR